jgi:hypothetical protein
MVVLKLILLSLITFRIEKDENLLFKKYVVYIPASNKFILFLFAMLWLLVIFGYDVIILSKLYETFSA